MGTLDQEKIYTIRFLVNKSMPEGSDKDETLKILADILGEKTKPKEPVRETPLPDEKGKVNFALIVGHEKKAPGAEFNNPKFKSEYDYNTAIAEKIKSYVNAGAYSGINLKVIFRDGIGINGAYQMAKTFGADACIELHFNAFNEKASGSETLSTIDTVDQKLSKLVHTEICKAFDRKGESRGVKVLSRGDRGGGNIYSMPGSANCLVEPFFGDNATEAKLAVERFDTYAKALLDGVYKWAKDAKLLA